LVSVLLLLISEETVCHIVAVKCAILYVPTHSSKLYYSPILIRPIILNEIIQQTGFFLWSGLP